MGYAESSTDSIYVAISTRPDYDALPDHVTLVTVNGEEVFRQLTANGAAASHCHNHLQAILDGGIVKAVTIFRNVLPVEKYSIE